MIKIENVEITGWKAAIRGMRNPKNSHALSDSLFCETAEFDPDDYPGGVKIGANDHMLMMALSKGGPVHAKYRRYIDVYVDITAPLYWWKEFETYRNVVADNPFDIEFNSCSTMHKIHDKEFTLDDFSHEHLLDRFIDDSCTLEMPVVGEYSEYFNPTDILQITIGALNLYRQRYLETKEKKYWWQMIQLLPSSYMQKRTVKMNYEVAAALHEWRKPHRMGDGHWDVVTDWIESLPYSEIITCEEA